MTGEICAGRVVAITGAGRGLGRAYALEFARQGAAVVVNDIGSGSDGSGDSVAPAQGVVEEILSAGGRAVASTDDVSDEAGARRFVEAAIDTFGGLDTLVNNAGILRDRTIVNMTMDDWDEIMRVHLRGTFAPTSCAAKYWRAEAKAGRAVKARLINTSSSSGLYNAPGQANYAAAKSGIATFTIVASKELARYNVAANAIYPTARSRLTEDILTSLGILEGLDEEGWPFDPSFVAPVVAWLGSDRCEGITGQVFGIRGDSIVLATPWEAGPSAETDRTWEPDELDRVIPGLVSQGRKPTEPLPAGPRPPTEPTVSS